VIIIDRLVKEGLIRPNEREKLGAQLAEGTLKPEDWNLAIEVATSKKRTT
jgi:hypothetical protein